MTEPSFESGEYPLALPQCFGYHRTMKAGPDIAVVASLVGDPARANMLTALMTGRALTASELAHQAGITPQTASSHLSKLEAGGLIEPEKQGRHRYYRLTGPDVAHVLEGLAGLAERAGHTRVRTGPKEPALRRARIRCWNRRSRRCSGRASTPTTSSSRSSTAVAPTSISSAAYSRR